MATEGALPPARGPAAQRLARLARLASDGVPAYLGARRAAKRGFLIFAQGRTGTWLLHSLLNQHPQIYCEKEILQQRVLSPQLYTLGRSRQAGGRIYGCHVQPHQLVATQRTDPAAYIDGFAQRGWRIIHLTRRDIIRQSISAIAAVERRQWVVRGDLDGPPKAVTLPIHKVLDRIRRRQSHLALEHQILSRHDHMPLVYEDDLASPDTHQLASDRIFAYLGIESVKVAAQTRPVLPLQLEEVIVNHDQLMESIAHTFPGLAGGN